MRASIDINVFCDIVLCAESAHKKSRSGKCQRGLKLVPSGGFEPSTN